MTPYYNTEYPDNLVCEWIISLTAEQKDLRLKFTWFELEESDNCTADYVVMRDGKDQNATLIGNKMLTRQTNVFKFNFLFLRLKIFNVPLLLFARKVLREDFTRAR